jgi:hypothetical protein
MRSWRGWSWVDGIFGDLGLQPRLGFEALKLDFLDDGRDISEINLLDGGFDNGIHFSKHSQTGS